MDSSPESSRRAEHGAARLPELPVDKDMDWDNLEAVRTAQGINIRRLARQLKVVKVATLSDFEHGHLNRLPFSDRKHSVSLPKNMPATSV